MKCQIKVEFHSHSCFSRDSQTPLETMLKTARKQGIDRLAITDHNTIRGALVAQKLDHDLVIIGEEILTSGGELLAYFVNEEIPRGLEPMDAIDRLKTQGAFISVPHPFENQRHGWQLKDLLTILPMIDAIEVFNSRCVQPELNARAATFAKEHDLAATVGSDAHTAFELGRSTLALPPFSTADELRSVIRQGVPETVLSPWWVHLFSVWAKMKRRRG